jgi:hypothetical protein
MELTSFFSPEYLKVRNSEVRKRTVFLRSARSVNPDYRNLDKLHDVTRFNSATYNVAHYQDFPNRQGTPIKAPRSPKSVERRTVHSPKYKHIKSMIGHKAPLRTEVVNGLIESAMLAPIRATTAGPTITRHRSGRLGGVINDYHSRETNTGFARNDFGGGFFTR